MRLFVLVRVPECALCPAGTEPVLGYEYKWWNVLPSNMKTSCFNVGNSKCDNMNGEHKHLTKRYEEVWFMKCLVTRFHGSGQSASMSAFRLC